MKFHENVVVSHHAMIQWDPREQELVLQYFLISFRGCCRQAVDGFYFMTNQRRGGRVSSFYCNFISLFNSSLFTSGACCSSEGSADQSGSKMWEDNNRKHEDKEKTPTVKFNRPQRDNQRCLDSFSVCSQVCRILKSWLCLCLLPHGYFSYPTENSIGYCLLLLFQE